MPILLGGVHASLCSRECLSDHAIDAVCIGEGEDVALSWVDAVARGARPSRIPGARIKIPGTTDIDSTPPAGFRTNLDQLPLINYAHWERWIDPDNRNIRVVVGRGCPYSCAFCSNHAIRALQSGPYVRFRSPKNILAEIEMLLYRFPGLDAIYLEIETIGASIPWLLDLCNHIARFNATLQRPIEFRANFAVTTHLVQDEDRLRAVLAALQRANFVALNVGLESGSPRIRQEILNRPSYTNADLIRFCQSAKQYGIGVCFCTLIGVPTETLADALETSNVARACDPERIYPSIYYPYPGTRLHSLSAQMSLINPSDLGTRAERSRVYLRLEGFPRWRVFFEYVIMNWRVFYGRYKTTRLLRYTVWYLLRIVPGLSSAIDHAERQLRRLRRRMRTSAPVPTTAA
jgi:radical SAM superfamily enzyme YgiQ (UPF0313 family)